MPTTRSGAAPKARASPRKRCPRTTTASGALTLLHTSASHVARFDALLAEVGGSARHVVREPLFAEARASGADDAVVQRQLRVVLASLARSSPVILCTCSTLGAAAEAFDGTFGARVLRVDRPLARAVVARGESVAVVAALASTLEPTWALLGDEAARAGKRVRVTLSVCEAAWACFERGDESAYLRAVARHAEQVAEQAEVIVLAQASMAGAEAFVRTDKPVLSSPRLGVQAALELLASAADTKT